MKEKILALLEQKKYPEIAALVKDMNPADAAMLLEELPQQSMPLIFRLLPKELAADAFAEALPAALRCVGALTGARDVDERWDEGDADAWRRAVCAAADAFAEYGEGRVGGFSIGGFSVTNYRDDGTTGAEVAREAALAELAGTGLAFSVVRR